MKILLNFFSFPGSRRSSSLTARLWVLSLLMILSTSVFAQQPAPTATPGQKIEEGKDEVLRINTNLIQVEAIVKDKSGNLVTDLKAEDFEIVENGAPRQLDFFSFVRADGVRESVSLPDNRLLPDQLRRTFVFLIGNPAIDFGYFYQGRWGVSSGTVSYRANAVRAAETASNFLYKFIDQQMGGRDLVSIVDTESSLGVLSSFTNDRELLRAAVAQMRKNVSEYPIARLTTVNGRLEISQLIQQNLAVLETARGAVRELKKVPGRKVVVLMSRALLYHLPLSETDVIKDRLKQLIAEANQAEVTFYFLSPSGLDVQVSGAAQKLAEETGGRSIYNTNDVSFGFAEILKENNGYYLLAYDAGQESVREGRRVQVRVKRDGLQVQTRSTVYKNEPAAESLSGKDNLLRILRSPLGTGEIRLTLSAAFQPVAKTRGIVKSAVAIDPANLKIETLADGTRAVKIDLAIQITGPDNKLLREDVKNYNLRLSRETWDQTLSHGLVYQFETPVRQPGFYRINVGVCVAGTGRCGTASRFVNAQPAKNN